MKKSNTFFTTPSPTLLLMVVLMLNGLHINAQMNGVYTIDSAQITAGRNFHSFKDAIDTLKKYGIDSAIVFNVATGTYKERVQIDSIPGVSPVNTITFDGGTGNSATRIITYAATGTNDRQTLQINSVPFVILRNLTIQTTGTAYGWGVHIMGASNGCQIKNCIIDIAGGAPTSNSQQFNGIAISNSSTSAINAVRVDSLEIDSNIINNGYYGISHYGATTAVKNRFRNNTLNNTYSTGISIATQNNPEVSNNTITMRTGGATIGNGIRIEACNSSGSDYTRITGNKILNPPQYGIYFASSNNTGTQKGLFANNVIGGYFANNNSKGIYLLNCSRWNIVHNSIRLDKATTSIAFDISSGTNLALTIYNNIFAITATGSSLLFSTNAVSNIDSMDYNIFNTVNPGDLIYVGTGFDVNNFKGGAGFNAHSLAVDPYFTSASDLSITTACNTGAYIDTTLYADSIAKDIASNIRNNPPAIGAYEYTAGGFTNNIAIDALISPSLDNIYTGSQNLTVRIKNMGTDPIYSFYINYELNNGFPVTEYYTPLTPLAPCDTVSVTFSGQINLGNANRLVIYTSQPNNNNDTYPADDTLKTLLYTPLTGNYTIGQTGDLISFNEALLLLNSMGVAGPVTFDVQSGTYPELVIISAITGVSATNTITFQSAVNHVDSVTVTNGIRLRDAKYINLKYMTLTGTYPVELTDAASFDSITYCRLNGSYAVWASVSLGSKNVFSHNNIIGSNGGFYLQGTPSTDSNVIAYNTIIGNVALELRNVPNTQIYNNQITSNTSYGLTLRANNGVRVINNSIITNNAANGRGIDINQGGRNQRFYHNTIRAAAQGIYVAYSNASDTANEWINNIITSSGGNNALYVQSNTPTTKNKWDYNIYHTNGTDPVYNIPFVAWQATGQDAHSVVANPGFVSLADLQLTSGCKLGTPSVNVNTDINDNARNTPPTIGAYEYLGVDDIAVEALVQPAVGTPIAGLQNLLVRVKNTGTNAVTSFNISYVLNNAAVISQQWNAGTLAPCDTVSVLIENVYMSDKNSLVIYTDNPNLNADTYTENDTFKVNINTPLSGNYLIGSGITAEFSSFSEAVTALINGGVSGKVVFDVEAGTYTEQLVIPTIAGASVTNTITFQSYDNNADSVILTYSVANGNPIVKLDDANYIHFKWLTVKTAGNSGIAFQLTNTASFDSITYSKINLGTGTGTTEGYSGIHAKNLLGGNNVFSNNTISGGSHGIYFWGVSETLRSADNIVSDNTITGVGLGANIRYTENFQIRNNTVSSTSGYALTIQNNYNALVITGNKLSSTGGGLNMSAVFGSAVSLVLVMNNTIRTTTNRGINVSNGAHQRFYHNSISNVATGTSTYGIYINYSTAADTANEWKNNIISHSGTTTTSNAVVINSNLPALKNTWDYNLYYTGGANLFYNTPSAYANHKANGQDKHSLVYRAAYISTTDLTSNPADSAVWAINGRGTYLDSSIISTDINGNSRPLKRENGLPDIGAYEVTPNAGVLAPAAKATGYLIADSTLIFISPFDTLDNDTVARIKWVVGSNVPDNIRVRQYVGEQPLGTSATDKFMYFYTDIEENGTGSYNYDIKLYYKDLWLGKIDTEHDLKLQRLTTVAPWVFNAGGFNSATDTTRNIITDKSLNVFGSFTGAELNNPLPVQLLSLKASAIQNDVLLTWSTASEVNTNRFVVERLVNGNQWLEIGKVKAEGNSSSVNNYQFTDYSPFITSNQLYYRLRIVDNDGSYEYSKVVSVSREQQAAQSLSVYPNPFSNHVNVAFVSTVDGTANINIVDITGRDVQLNISKNIVKGNNILTIDTDKLNSGIYFLSVEMNGEKQIVKLVKQ